jgi:DNA-binding CsgD family transcriptional regulator
VQLPGDTNGLRLGQPGSGGEHFREAVRSQRLAYLSSQLALASPQHRPWTKPDSLAELLGRRGQPRRSLGIVDRERQAGEPDQDQTHVAGAVNRQAQSQALWIDLSLRHARAVLAEGDEDAGARFDEALGADLGLWPFPRARILLTHGQWLRRHRRIAESRSPLRAARDAFDALGCKAWSDQARRELRASGESSRRSDPAARDQLTAQELQIAQLAALGLSNREIGQRLYLSHRTIGTHLYRTFPKLGITSRSELRSALESTSGLEQRTGNSWRTSRRRERGSSS